jgi:transcription antitermination factor NusG
VRDRRIVRGRKVTEAPALFPGYAFVFIELQWHAARYALGVASLIMDLRGRERGGLIKMPPPPKPVGPFLPGDRLRVCSGPLTGLKGLYAGMAPRERIFVLLQMLGGERTVELAQGDVLKISTGRYQVS